MPDSKLPRGYILGFDFGLRRIGVAVGQATTMTASSVEIVQHAKTPDWSAIQRIVKEWRPAVMVVGLPLGPEGDETDMSRAARKFGTELEQRFELPVHYADERHTSQAAQSQFVDLRAAGGLKRKHAGKLDAAAARLIVEQWMHTTAAGGGL